MFEDTGVICASPVVILAVVCLSLVRGEFKEVYRFQETLPTAPRSVISTSTSLIHNVEMALLLDDKVVPSTNGLLSEKAV